jgi:hypothetical protein
LLCTFFDMRDTRYPNNLYDASQEIYFLHPYVGEVDKLRTTLGRTF